MATVPPSQFASVKNSYPSEVEGGIELAESIVEDEQQVLPRSRIEKVFRETVSYISSGFSLLSLAVVGKRLPIYQDSSAKQKLDNLAANANKAWKNFSANFPRISRTLAFANNAKNSLIKNAVNLVLIAVNASLAIVDVKLPIFEETVTAKAVESLKKSWNKLEEVKYIGWPLRMSRKGFEQTRRFFTSPFAKNILAYGLGILAIGSGPWGLALVSAVVATDIINGAVTVNNIRVHEDELMHLRSIKSSRQKINSLDSAAIEKIQERLGIANPLSNSEKKLKKGQSNGVLAAIKKSILPIAISQTVRAVDLLSKAITPLSAIVAASEVAISTISIVNNKLTNQDAKELMREEIAKLRAELGVSYDIDKSRKYDLAEIACQYKIYAETVSNYKEGVEKSNPKYKEEIKNAVRGEEIFRIDKTAKPTGYFSYLYRAAKVSVLSMSEYLHPFKPAPSYVETWEKMQKSSEMLPKPLPKRSAVYLAPDLTPDRHLVLNRENKNASERLI